MNILNTLGPLAQGFMQGRQQRQQYEQEQEDRKAKLALQKLQMQMEEANIKAKGIETDVMMKRLSRPDVIAGLLKGLGIGTPGGAPGASPQTSQGLQLDIPGMRPQQGGASPSGLQLSPAFQSPRPATAAAPPPSQPPSGTTEGPLAGVNPGMLNLIATIGIDQETGELNSLGEKFMADLLIKQPDEILVDEKLSKNPLFEPFRGKRIPFSTYTSLMQQTGVQARFEAGQEQRLSISREGMELRRDLAKAKTPMDMMRLAFAAKNLAYRSRGIADNFYNTGSVLGWPGGADVAQGLMNQAEEFDSLSADLMSQATGTGTGFAAPTPRQGIVWPQTGAGPLRPMGAYAPPSMGGQARPRPRRVPQPAISPQTRQERAAELARQTHAANLKTDRANPAPDKQAAAKLTAAQADVDAYETLKISKVSVPDPARRGLRNKLVPWLEAMTPKQQADELRKYNQAKALLAKAKGAAPTGQSTGAKSAATTGKSWGANFRNLPGQYQSWARKKRAQGKSDSWIESQLRAVGAW